MIKHEGGCQCGRIRFEVLAPKVIKVAQCNCSICSKSGFLGLTAPPERQYPQGRAGSYPEQ